MWLDAQLSIDCGHVHFNSEIPEKKAPALKSSGGMHAKRISTQLKHGLTAPSKGLEGLAKIGLWAVGVKVSGATSK